MSTAANSAWKIGGGGSIDCSRPRVMAIVNATPDSFFAGSRIDGSGAELRPALEALAASSPDIIDIGGQSTRPGSPRVAAVDELQRVLPVIELLRELAPQIPLSIDTYHSWVARKALEAGCSIVNDIGAGSLDEGMWPLVAEKQCGYVLMHMQGSPETMQQAPTYTDCLWEVELFLAEKLAALGAHGVPLEHIVLDPGIGFGKRLEDNLTLIRGAARLAAAGRPLLYGVSRKSFIGRLAPEGDPAREDAEYRLPGTLGLTWELLSRGAMLHRVHDVAATRQVMGVWEALQKRD